jgi:protein-S-isoprenylcysteine O-methyltransferase Ste14
VYNLNWFGFFTVIQQQEIKMKFKGMASLSKHIDDLNSTVGRVRLALYAFILFLLVTTYFIITDHIPTWSIDSEIIISSLGFLILSLFFSKRKAYKEQYKENAYRNAFVHFVIPGLALIFGAVAHAGYMNGPFVPGGWWTTLFSTIGWYMLFTGTALWIRSVLEFGADNLALLYVYYPEEGRINASSIFGILRHPVYSSVLHIWIGLALLNGNANSVIFTIFIPLGLTGWIRLVEEKELIGRFGQSYIDYRKQIPAFLPHLRDIGKFFTFLASGR